MSWQTQPWAVGLRNVGRSLGLNRWIAARLYSGGYETRYDEALAACLRQGDIVWDIGANVGHYTRLFAERVGDSGQVIAFEPSPVNFLRLQQSCGALVSVKLCQMGLGREDGRLSFQQGADALGATSRVLETSVASADEETIQVDIRRGLGLIESGKIPAPNALKIDVEGFELEVLEGLGEALAALELRTLGIEMHFGILQDRGMGDAPQRIEALLKRQGYRLSWPDASHLLATRA